jgi:solute carrier family 25 (mitochondrial folate transporter), member 32
MEKPAPKKKYVNFVSGIFAGIANVLVCAPLDTVKTRLQVQHLYTPEYSGILNTLKKIRKTEGIKGLYQGMSVSLISYPCSWSIYFYFYERFKEYFQESIENKTIRSIISSGISGFISTIVTNPLWLIRARMQVQQNNNLSGFKVFREVVNKDGYLSLYRGLTASLIGMSHVIVYFPLYEICKVKIGIKENPQFLQILVCSTPPKIIASMVSYPHEVIRSRYFIHEKTEDERFKGLYGLIKFTYKSEGFKGFYGGFFANLLRILPSTFATIYTYEKFKYYLLNL